MTAGARRASLKSLDDGNTDDFKDQPVDYSIFPSDVAVDDKMSMDRVRADSDGRSFNNTIQAKLTNFNDVRVKTKGLN